MIELLDTIYGKMYVPDTDNGQYGWLKTMGASPEHEQIELICELLKEHGEGWAIDCGANFGCWSLALARANTLGVVSFEPQRKVCRMLEATVWENRLVGKVMPFQVALGPAPGTIKVPDVDVDTATNFGGISLGVRHPEQPDAPMLDCEVVKLDDFVEPPAPVSFIKADVEGAELGLLKGAERTIRRWKPIIVCEADHPLTDTQALGAYIESLGYNVEVLQDNNFIGMPV